MYSGMCPSLRTPWLPAGLGAQAAAFPLQLPVVRPLPQPRLLPSPTALARLPPTGAHRPPPLLWSCSALGAWLVSTGAWVPLSSGEALFPSLDPETPRDQPTSLIFPNCFPLELQLVPLQVTGAGVGQLVRERTPFPMEVFLPCATPGLLEELPRGAPTVWSFFTTETFPSPSSISPCSQT